MEIINDSNRLPEGVLNVVTGFGEEAGAPLAEHPHVDKVALLDQQKLERLLQGSLGT